MARAFHKSTELINLTVTVYVKFLAHVISYAHPNQRSYMVLQGVGKSLKVPPYPAVLAHKMHR
jgi:hypothetical protein